jgi:bifunctional non-homologous end joining protein LigD
MQPIESELHGAPEELFRDDAWAAQEKIDGKRCVVTCTTGELRAVTRNGNPIKLPAKARALLPLGNYIVDGELVGNDFTAFDVLSIGADDVRTLPYSQRLAILDGLHVPQIVTHYGEAAKRALHAAVQSAGREGIVFKRLAAKWRAGRTADAVKLKFWKSDTFVVESFDGRGIAIRTMDGKPAGRCAGGANVGDLVEIRFAHWTEAGKLMHPAIIGIRDDLA